MSDQQHPEGLEIFLETARDLTASLAAEDRYERLLGAVRKLIPCDAACLLRLQGEELIPVAAHGLTDEALVRSYPRKEHPRLDIILASRGRGALPGGLAPPRPLRRLSLL